MKSARAKLARETLDRIIPSIFTQNPNLVTSTTVFAADDLTLPKPLRDQPPTVRILEEDTFEAARDLASSDKVAVLNMCSVTSPGGGFVRGCLAQEESLCMRSTLYPALLPIFYPIKHGECLYTPNVLVFKNYEGEMLRTKDRFLVDVISCPAPKNPALSRSGNDYRDVATSRIMEEKMRLILSVAASQGVSKVVVGAFGCGAYNNPPLAVANLWKKVIFDHQGPCYGRFEEVVFAILDGSRDHNIPVFRSVFE